MRLASAEQYPGALAEVKLAVEETERRLTELGTSAYIVYVDATVATALAAACEEVQRYIERAQVLSKAGSALTMRSISNRRVQCVRCSEKVRRKRYG